MNITFTTQAGHIMNIVCNYKTTVKDLLIKYVTRMGLGPAVLGDSLFFLFNGSKIKQNDNRTVEELGLGLISLFKVVLINDFEAVI